jgi:hypothetical protein
LGFAAGIDAAGRKSSVVVDICIDPDESAEKVEESRSDSGLASVGLDTARSLH